MKELPIGIDGSIGFKSVVYLKYLELFTIQNGCKTDPQF